MRCSELSWVTNDGRQILGRVWQPEEEPRGVVCLVHGLGEHSGRYEHVGRALADAGYALWAFDLRGHGRSQGPRGHVSSWDALFDDVSLSVDSAAKQFPNAPLFLYGHSLGGTIVLTFCLARKPSIAGVIVTAPLLRTAFEPPAWKLALGKLLYRAAPGFSMNNELDPQGLSHDSQVVSAYVHDPLVHKLVSARLALDLIEQGKTALQRAGEWSLPLLLMNGTADPICSPQAVSVFAKTAGTACTYRAWEGLFHELHNELEQQEILQAMIAWLRERTRS